MEVRAIGKNFRIPPRKVRIVAKEVKGKHAVHAMGLLAYHTSKSARLLGKVLRSAIANAVNNHDLSAETLVIRAVKVDEGYRLKRIQPRSMGRANRILKRTSHITVILDEGDAFALPKSNANPKPRPRLDWPKAKKESKKADPVEQPEVEAAEAATDEAPEEAAGSAEGEES